MENEFLGSDLTHKERLENDSDYREGFQLTESLIGLNSEKEQLEQITFLSENNLRNMRLFDKESGGWGLEAIPRSKTDALEKLKKLKPR